MKSLFRVWVAALMAVFMLGVPFAVAQDADERFVRGSSPGYYFIPAGQVFQDTNSAAIQIHDSSIPDYTAGLQLIFETKIINGNNANITLEARNRQGLVSSSKGVKKLLTRDGQEFGIGELNAGVFITATYTGENFRADFNKRPQFRYAEPVNLSLTGNAYSFTDASIPPIATEPVLIGIKAEATNTGNVTLSVNNSTDYPVYLSNGNQIPAGALEDGEFILCAFTTIGGVGFRALNLRPARDLKGRLVATLDITSQLYIDFQFLEGWQIETGVTELGTENLPADIFFGNEVERVDALITLPNERINGSQLGWFFEVLNGTTVVNSFFKTFGGAATFGGRLTTDNENISFFQQDHSAGNIAGIDADAISVIVAAGVTIPAGYSIKMYITEN